MPDTELEPILHAWQEIALDDYRPMVDRQASTMKVAEERSQKARKQLANMLKTLKQAQQTEQDQSVVNRLITDTIKSFQKEVDELTRRSTYAETCFLQVSSKICQAPNPVAALSVAVKEKEKYQVLRQKVEEGKADLDCIKKQEATIRELEQRLKKLSEGEIPSSNLQAQAMHSDIERNRLLEEALLRENLLHQELQKCRDLLYKTQVQLEDLQARFVIFHDRKENEDATKEQFSDSINEEMLSLKSQLATMKHENIQLKESLSRASDDSTNETVADVKRRARDTQQQLTQLLRNYNSCLQKNEVLRRQVIDHANCKATFERRHQAEVELLQDKIRSLTETIRSLPSLEEFNLLKQQLNSLQIMDRMDNEGEVTTGFVRAPLDNKETLEPELARIRLEQSLQTQLGETAQGLVSRASGSDEKQILATSLSPLHDITRSGTKEFLSFQRDRYRKAIDSLEIEKATLQTRNDSLLQQLNVLKNDNESLYLRLMASQPNNNKTREIDLEHGLALENKYAKIVEERQNPFSRLTTHRGHGQLNVMERTVLIGTKICLGRRSLRTASFVYIITLHALVFFSLLTHTVIPHCPQNTKR